MKSTKGVANVGDRFFALEIHSVNFAAVTELETRILPFYDKFVTWTGKVERIAVLTMPSISCNFSKY